MEVSEPDPANQSCGILEVSTEISPSINLKSDKRKLQDQGVEISNQLKRYCLFYCDFEH